MNYEEWYFEKVDATLSAFLNVPYLLKHNCTKPWYSMSQDYKSLNMYFWDKSEVARKCHMCNRVAPDNLINLYKLYCFMEKL